MLTDAKVKISMPLVTLLSNALPVTDGKGRWIDNRMIEQLSRSLKYERVYLHAFEKGSEAKASIWKWLDHYNPARPYSTHGVLNPDKVCASQTATKRFVA